ncbi:multidrug effflux MFS transporter [Comamonas sp. J-3]|uniref:multidrug effflux MFS transporter n=1 Tax=Comamonas trifloxystrobinivorans TaxID=3350256 RepID=UPI00372BAB58
MNDQRSPIAPPSATPQWVLAVMLAMLGMLGPFAIDTYLPAFDGIAHSLQASPLQMQQTLSAYLFGFAFMNLFHGALSDSLGRRPVVLWGLAAFALTSAGCALAQTPEQLILFRALQGCTTGAGIVVSRAVVRDLFPPAQAQRVMSQITIYFGIAPAIAPMIGGALIAYASWQSIFWLLFVIGALLWLYNWRLLPESLPPSKRQPFDVKNLMHGYWQLCSSPRFLLLAAASGVPFNGMFIYILSAPTFLGTHMKMQPTQFFWFFLCTIGGIMAGAWVSGRLAGKIPPKRQVRHGFLIMFLTSFAYLLLNLLLPPHPAWALLPVGVYSFGWALMTPVVTLLVLDLHPERRGLASSLQAVVSSVANGLVAGVLAPLVMDSTIALAIASVCLMLVGLCSWIYFHHRWPHIGRHSAKL